MSSAESSCWGKLPAEMIRMIFSHLNTYEALLTCCLFPEENLVPHSFFKEMRLVSEFRLKVDTPVFDYLTHPDRNMLVESLDISNNYWIPEDSLETLVEGLPNLRSLFAFDTKLRWHNGWRFETVGLTHCHVTAPLPMDMNVRDLHLHVDTTSFGRAISCALQVFKVKNVHFYSSQFSSYLARLKRIVFYLRSTRYLTVTFTNFDIGEHFMEKAENWFSHRGWTICKIVYEDVGNMFSWYDFKTAANFNWSRKPYDMMELISMESDDEEYHPNMHNLIVEKRLNVANLKTLIIPWETCMRQFESKSVLTMFLDCSPLLEEIVIAQTDDSCCNALHSIIGFKHLRSLQLIETNHGSLLDIFRSCTNLTSLTLWSVNLKDDNNLYAELFYAKSLKNLTLKLDSIDVKKLLHYIPKSVTRVMLCCRQLININDLRQLLKDNPQLIFFGVNLCCCGLSVSTEKDKAYISQVMEVCRHSSTQIFVVWRSPKNDIPNIYNKACWNFNGVSISYARRVPELHSDMIYNRCSAVYSL